MNTRTFSGTDPRVRMRKWYVRLLPIVLLVSALGHIVMIASLTGGSRPIRLHEDSSLTYLVRREGLALGREFAFYMELHDHGAGGVLVVPPEHPFSPELVRSFSGMTLEVLDYDTALPEQLIPDGEETGTFDYRNRSSDYWIIAGGDGDRWWFATFEGGFAIVQDSVEPVPGSSP